MKLLTQSELYLACLASGRLARSSFFHIFHSMCRDAPPKRIWLRALLFMVAKGKTKKTRGLETMTTQSSDWQACVLTTVQQSQNSLIAMIQKQKKIIELWIFSHSNHILNLRMWQLPLVFAPSCVFLLLLRQNKNLKMCLKFLRQQQNVAWATIVWTACRPFV